MRGRDETATRDGECDSDDYTTANEAIGSGDDDQSSSEATRNEKHTKQAGNSGHRAFVGIRQAGLSRFRRTHPPLNPTPGFRKYPRRKLRATDIYAERWMNGAEMAQYWYEKFEKEKERVKRRDTEIEEMDTEIEQLNAEITEWEHAHRAQFDRAEEEAAKYKREKEKLEKLLASHVRAVNSVSSGLEPVTDQTFAEKFEKLHHEVGSCSL